MFKYFLRASCFFVFIFSIFLAQCENNISFGLHSARFFLPSVYGIFMNGVQNLKTLKENEFNISNNYGSNLTDSKISIAYLEDEKKSKICTNKYLENNNSNEFIECIKEPAKINLITDVYRSNIIYGKIYTDVFGGFGFFYDENKTSFDPLYKSSTLYDNIQKDDLKFFLIDENIAKKVEFIKLEFLNPYNFFYENKINEQIDLLKSFFEKIKIEVNELEEIKNEIIENNKNGTISIAKLNDYIGLKLEEFLKNKYKKEKITYLDFLNFCNEEREKSGSKKLDIIFLESKNNKRKDFLSTIEESFKNKDSNGNVKIDINLNNLNYHLCDLFPRKKLFSSDVFSGLNGFSRNTDYKLFFEDFNDFIKKNNLEKDKFLNKKKEKSVFYSDFIFEKYLEIIRKRMKENNIENIELNINLNQVDNRGKEFEYKVNLLIEKENVNLNLYKKDEDDYWKFLVKKDECYIIKNNKLEEEYLDLFSRFEDDFKNKYKDLKLNDAKALKIGLSLALFKYNPYNKERYGYNKDFKRDEKENIIDFFFPDCEYEDGIKIEFENLNSN